MRIFLFLSLSLFVWGCSTVQVTKEVIKVTNTITNKVKHSVPQKENENKVVLDETINKKEIEEEIIIIKKKQEKEKKIIESQQKLVKINFIGKTENKIFNLLGQAQLIRVDGSVYTLRYNSNNCRLFLFFNQEKNNKIVEYFEIRNIKAELLNSKKSLEQCYREFKLMN
ncbi:hypothetical protein PQZ42_00310 [Alphaproteobacteria bacterium]|nr:hypothetical protein [Alphaproteobacteria bacterium]